MEHITTTRVEKGLKRGKKKKVPEEEVNYITKQLKQWRDETLMDAYYGDLTSFSALTVMGDHIIDSISHCGERVRDYSQLRRHVRWANGHDTEKNVPNQYGLLLMEELARIYDALDTRDKRVKEREEEAKREAERRQRETLHYIHQTPQ